MKPDPFSVRLQLECTTVAHEAMAKPSNDLFGYGRAVGFYAGLARAAQLFEEMQREDDERRSRY